MSENKFTALITGPSKRGKTTSLRNVRDAEHALFLNLEAGKPLPFRAKFTKKDISDPKLVPKYIETLEQEKNAHFHSIFVDTVTMMMDLYENLYIFKAADKQAGWQHFQQFWKELMQVHVANSTKNVVMLAHTMPVFNDTQKVIESKIPIKGGLKNIGIEAYFTVVIPVKIMPVEELKDYENDLLTITEEEKILGVKHVFQTKHTEESLSLMERISSPFEMWSTKETFIDNDVQLVLDRMKEYYQ